MSLALPRQFFASTLPARAAGDVHRLFASEGSIAFKVDDAAWTFRFGSVEPVESRFDRSADLHLWFTAAAFNAFVDGSLDIAEATRTRAVKAQGDLRLLALFGRFLQGDDAVFGFNGGS